MKIQTFFDNFELLAEAPNGVRKLRELILQFAIHGKLVPQYPNENSVAEAFKSIRIATGRLTNPLPESVAPPFSIPEGWIWIRLGDTGTTQTGTTPPKGDKDSYGRDFPFIKPADIYPSHVNYHNEGLSSKGVQRYGRLAPAGSVLMVCIGTIGKANFIDRECSFNQQINALTPYPGLNSRLINYFMRSPYFQSEAWLRSSRTTIAILNKGKWEKIPIPLPPVEEQKRIVAKVDELMKFCDELEECQQKSHEVCIHLNNSALERLLAASTAEEFDAHWQRIGDNFDLLYDTRETIGKLRQSVIELAVQGKLVQPNPNDEPATALLTKIKAEKECLIKAGVIKQNGPFPSINGELPVPNSWCIERLGNLVFDLQNGLSKRHSDEGEPYPVLRLADIKDGKLTDRSLREINMTKEEIGKYRVDKGNILIIRVNGSPELAGRFIPCNSQREWAYSDHLIRARVSSELVVTEYLCLFANSENARRYLSSKIITTAGQKTINQSGLSSLPILLPPLKEQKRIVAKVNKIMRLCDALETKLNQAQSLSEHLTASVVNQIFSTAEENTTASAALPA